MYQVYILKCADNTLYTGITNDLKNRLLKHNGELPGGAKYTRARRPVKLVYRETQVTKGDALKRELQIKKYTKQKKLGLIEGGNQHLLFDQIKSYTLSDAIQMEESDRQYKALERLWQKINVQKGDKKHKVSFYLLSIIINALLAYQLSGNGEDYWEEFEEYFSSLYHREYELVPEKFFSDFLSFMQKSKNNKRLINMKEKRLKKLVTLIPNIKGKEAYFYKNMDVLLGLIARSLKQKQNAKTVTFAIKMFGYGARNFYSFQPYPEEIFIPIDSRLTKLFEKYKGNYSDIFVFYYDLALLSKIPMLHLDGIVWNETEKLLEN